MRGAGMPRPLTAMPMIQEPIGLTLNPLGRRDEAEQVSLDLIRDGNACEGRFRALMSSNGNC